MRVLRSFRDRLLTLGAVVGGALIVAVVLGTLLGVRPIFLKSGSMAPSMSTGSLALARQVPADSLRVGDVVCIETSAGVRVTHRIVGIERIGSVAVLRLRGDANQASDAGAYSVTQADRVIAHVPWVGYLFGWLGTPIGLITMGVLAASLLMLLVRGDRSPPPSTGGGKRRATAPSAVGALVLFVTLGPGQIGPASAAPWTDDANITGSTFTATTIAVPATFTCGGLGLLSVQFNWSAVAGATNYTLHYGSGGASTSTITGTSATLTAAIAGGTAWVVANKNYGSTTWSSVASVTRTYTVAVVSLCS